MFRNVIAVFIVLAAALGAHADQVQLVTGEVLQGQIVGRSEEGVILVHPIFGRLKIPAGSVKAIVMTQVLLPRPAQGNATPATQPATPAPAPTAGGIVQQTPIVPPPLTSSEMAQISAGTAPYAKPWKSQLTIGIVMGQNADETLAGNIGIKSQKTTADERFTLDASYFYAETDSQATRNEFTSGVLKDWLIRDSPWFYFGQGRFDYAEFRPYRERLSGATGPGYQFIKDEKTNILFRLGVGGYQQWGTDDNVFHPEVSLGTEASWQLTPKQKLAMTETFYADAEFLGRYRNIASADWTIKIDQFSGLSLKFSVQDEYDSFISSNLVNITHNDARFVGGLQLDF